MLGFIAAIFIVERVQRNEMRRKVQNIIFETSLCIHLATFLLTVDLFWQVENVTKFIWPLIAFHLTLPLWWFHHLTLSLTTLKLHWTKVLDEPLLARSSVSPKWDIKYVFSDQISDNITQILLEKTFFCHLIGDKICFLRSNLSQREIHLTCHADQKNYRGPETTPEHSVN